MKIFSVLALAVLLSSDAVATEETTEKLQARGGKISEDLGACYFSQAPAAIGDLVLVACQQFYQGEIPYQCCLYSFAGVCAMLCNSPAADDPLHFFGKQIPCDPNAAQQKP